MKRDLRQFVDQTYINLETFRKNGKPVRTPVWFVGTPRGEPLYVRTIKTSGKVKRIHGNRRVNLVPCDQAGEPLGNWLLGYAHEATDSQTVAFVRGLMLEKYGEMLIEFEERARANGQEYTVLVIDQIGE